MITTYNIGNFIKIQLQHFDYLQLLTPV